MTSTPKRNCNNCQTRKPADDVLLVNRKGGGSYRKASGGQQCNICRECVQELLPRTTRRGILTVSNWSLQGLRIAAERFGMDVPPREQASSSTAPRVVPDFAQGIPAATVAFRATLTATTNEHLRDRLPLSGLVMIHERSVDGDCQFVTFMPDPEPGKGTSFVSVPHAEFTFSTRV